MADGARQYSEFDEGSASSSRMEMGSSWWTLSYVLDYAIVAAIFGLAGFIQVFIEPFHMPTPFDTVNPTGTNSSYAISMPYEEASISNWLLPFIGIGVPLIVFTSFALARKLVSKNPDALRDLHTVTLALMLAVGLSGLATVALKMAGGRLRPDFVSRVASADLKRMRDGRMSFPSGHASMSNAGMSMIVHWIAGKLHTFSRHTDAWRLVTSLSPFTISMYVAMTRTREHRHNYSDVLAGFLIGLAAARVSYSLYFPPLTSYQCHSARPRSRGSPDAANDAC